jgi:hypothetical protein
MEREKPADQRCQHEFENGKQCDRTIDGQGGWLYCSECRKAAWKQAKKLRDAERRKGDDNRAKDNFYHWLYDHRLTESKLIKRVERAESLRDEYPSSLDDFDQVILDDLQKLRDSLLNPTTDMPNAALAAKVDTSLLLYVLNLRRKEAGANIVTEKLIADVMDLQRDIGDWKSRDVFAKMRKKAEDVIELRHERGELLNLIYALFTRAEVGRLKFLDNPTNKKFMKEARTWVNASKSVCELAIKHYTGTPKRRALYLDFWVPLNEAILAFNSGELEQGEDILKSIQKKSNAVADAYGTHPVSEHVTYLCAWSKAELCIQHRNIDDASHHLKEAEKAFENMQWRSVESELYLAHAKSGLALARSDQKRQDDLEELQKYLLMYQRSPFLTNRHHFQELKRLYPKDVPDSPILKSTRVYIDTMGRHMMPVLLND